MGTEEANTNQYERGDATLIITRSFKDIVDSKRLKDETTNLKEESIMAKAKIPSPKPKSKAQNVVDTWADPRTLGISDRSFFKPEDGKTKRIHLMGDPVRAHVQYVQGLGFIKSFCQYENRNGAQVMVEQGIDVDLLGREPQMLWMVPVLVYDTDKKGQVGGKVEYEFQLWSFYANDYKRLYTMVTEWGRGEFMRKDLLVTGTKKGKYINADFNVAAKDALCLAPGVCERVEAEFSAYQYRDANRWIARDVTEDELRAAVANVDQSTGKVADAQK
ncbi:MAG: hypothetical protein WC052_04750 [Patescibacteria group bacterium]|jgi:hypothetical protein